MYSDFTALMESLSWHNDALCAQTDPDAFYPEDTPAGSLDAKRICRLCDVRTECLYSAIVNTECWGIWGGLSTEERRALAKHLRQSGKGITKEAVAEWIEAQPAKRKMSLR